MFFVLFFFAYCIKFQQDLSRLVKYQGKFVLTFVASSSAAWKDIQNNPRI